LTALANQLVNPPQTMAAKTACLLFALFTLAASSPEACSSETCANPSAGSSVAGSSMIQKVDMPQKQSKDLAEDDAELLDASDEEVFELAQRAEEWQELAGGCAGCLKGCVVHGKCYKQGPSGKPTTEGVCLHYNGTWCDSAPSCGSCAGGCIVKGQCYHKTPWGKAVDAGMCVDRARGQWCGAKPPPAPTCDTCKDGCLARGKCFMKTPTGGKPTEQMCMYHGGKWCGKKATCDGCSDGCLVMGKCYTKQHLPKGSGKMTDEAAIKMCKKHGGTLCAKK